MMNSILRFIDEDIWKINLQDLPKSRAYLIKYLRIIILSVRGFSEDRGPLRASALTLYTLLSIVPLAALAFGIAKGFGYERLLEEQLMQQIPEQEAMLQQVMVFARSLLENTRGGLVAGIGVVLLFYTIIKVLSNIEATFNDIWAIKKGRSIGRKFSDYLSLIVICPLLVILSSSATVFLATRAAELAEDTFFSFVGSIILFGLRLLPYVILWLLFSFIYIFMPNTRVRYRSGIFAGIVTGTIYQIVQIIYISLQVGVSKYNAIYGSFAALPLFIIWLQLSWFIVLFGAEFSFVHQHFRTLEHDSAFQGISFLQRKLLSLQVVHLLVKQFTEGGKPLTTSQISLTLDIPLHLLREVLDGLQESGLVSEIKVQEEYEEAAFQPARDPATLTISSVVQALEEQGNNRICSPPTRESQLFSEALMKFAETIEHSPANKLIKKI